MLCGRGGESACLWGMAPVRLFGGAVCTLLLVVCISAPSRTCRCASWCALRGLEQGVFSDPGSLLPWAGRGGGGCVVSLSPRLHLWTVLGLKVLEHGLQVWP